MLGGTTISFGRTGLQFSAKKFRVWPSRCTYSAVRTKYSAVGSWSYGRDTMHTWPWAQFCSAVFQVVLAESRYSSAVQFAQPRDFCSAETNLLGRTDPARPRPLSSAQAFFSKQSLHRVGRRPPLLPPPPSTPRCHQEEEEDGGGEEANDRQEPQPKNKGRTHLSDLRPDDERASWHDDRRASKREAMTGKKVKQGRVS